MFIRKILRQISHIFNQKSQRAILQTFSMLLFSHKFLCGMRRLLRFRRIWRLLCMHTSRPMRRTLRYTRARQFPKSLNCFENWSPKKFGASSKLPSCPHPVGSAASAATGEACWGPTPSRKRCEGTPRERKRDLRPLWFFFLA